MAARNKARQGQCNSNLHQIGMAIQLYAQDHDDLLPIGGYNTPTPPPIQYVFVPFAFGTGTGKSYRIDWRDVLLGMQYLTHAGVLTCPAATNTDYRSSY